MDAGGGKAGFGGWAEEPDATGTDDVAGVCGESDNGRAGGTGSEGGVSSIA